MVYVKHPKNINFEYNKISPKIYLGTNQCCQTHFNKSLLKEGVKADISLEKERLDSPFGVKYFLWLPVKDGAAPTLSQLFIGATTLKNLLDKNIKVYIHCKSGHGRSPTLVAAYFILNGSTVNKAINKIRNKRKIHLTKQQIAMLKVFKKSINN